MDCPGVGKMPDENKKKQVYGNYTYNWKWECPDCGKFVGKDGKGGMNKHKALAPTVITKTCPQCEEEREIDKNDYICVECRNTTDTRFIGLFDDKESIIGLYIKGDMMKMTINGQPLVIQKGELTVGALEGMQRWVK